jgi:hypothetical protein
MVISTSKIDEAPGKALYIFSFNLPGKAEPENFPEIKQRIIEQVIRI